MSNNPLFQNISKLMTETFTSLAKSGHPNQVPDDTETGIEWKRYQKSGSFFVFGGDPGCRELDPTVRDRIDFWNEVIVKEGQLLTWKKSDIPIPKIHEKPAGSRRD